MKILTSVTASGGMSLGSGLKDTFTVGSELERDAANADVLTVWANARFNMMLFQAVAALILLQLTQLYS